MLLLLVTGCLFDRATYETRLAALTDGDGDGWSEVDGDCDDRDVAIAPKVGERCKKVDDDCDGEVDEAADLTDATWYVDADGDGAGAGEPFVTCTPTRELVPSSKDCDDGDADVFPGAPEACNGQDDDCNGTIDDPETVATLDWYPDGDADGFGDGTTIASCADPGGASLADGDCDDADSAVNPGATETCNGVDDDCNGAVDDAPAVTWYLDRDEDGFGDDDVTYLVCSPPPGYAERGGDCDDGEQTVHPGAWDACEDGADADCDGLDVPCGIPTGEAGPDDVSATFTGDAGELYVARTVASAGDLDGDGDDELVIARPGANGLVGEIRVVAGDPTLRLGEQPLDSTGAALRGTTANAAFGTALSAGSDIDGDGTPDLLVVSLFDGNAYLFTQGAALLAGGLVDTDATLTLPGPSADDEFGLSVALLGDVDDDGLGDWAIGDPTYDGGRGAAFLYYGDRTTGTRDTDAPDVVTLTGLTVDAQGGHEVAAIGDFDGDGVGDWAVADNVTTGEGAARTRLFTYMGGSTRVPSGSLDGADLIWEGMPTDGAFAAVSDGADVNGDGRPDAVFGAPKYADDAGIVEVVFGDPVPSASGDILALADVKWAASTPGARLGESVGVSGELTGDGYADVTASTTRTGTLGPALYLLPGGAGVHGDYDLADTSLHLNGGNTELEGVGIANALDFNGDGAQDLLLSAWDDTTARGQGWMIYNAP